jgi:hypothetical protein
VSAERKFFESDRRPAKYHEPFNILSHELAHYTKRFRTGVPQRDGPSLNRYQYNSEAVRLAVSLGSTKTLRPQSPTAQPIAAPANPAFSQTHYEGEIDLAMENAIKDILNRGDLYNLPSFNFGNTNRDSMFDLVKKDSSKIDLDTQHSVSPAAQKANKEADKDVDHDALLGTEDPDLQASILNDVHTSVQPPTGQPHPDFLASFVPAGEDISDEIMGESETETEAVEHEETVESERGEEDVDMEDNAAGNSKDESSRRPPPHPSSCPGPDLDGKHQDSDDEDDDGPPQGGMGAITASGTTEKPTAKPSTRATRRPNTSANKATKPGRVIKSSQSSKKSSGISKAAQLKSKDMSKDEKKRLLWAEIINKSGFMPVAKEPGKPLSVADCRGLEPVGCSPEAWVKQFVSADCTLRRRIDDPHLAKEMREEGWLRDQALALYTKNQGTDTGKKGSEQQSKTKQKPSKKSKKQPDSEEEIEDEENEEDEE